ncbi:MAG: TetR/AcrR family transcriptional regulator [Rhodococcus ruber]|nr:TetR/AcrR family transcriptional regulator [Rhodococcus ruber]
MGRPPGFDATDVVERARDLFWDKGFEATSVPELERATGLNRSSLYNAFSSKRGLFDAAVRDYLDRVVRPRLRVLTDEPVAADAAARYFRALARTVAALPDDSPRRGCLLLNSAAGLAAHDEAQRAVVAAYRTELATAFGHALRALDPAADDETLAHPVRTLASLSLSTLLLARIDRDEAVATAETALAQLDEWRASAR